MNGIPNKILLIGYGNPGRLDDGLGPAIADAVEKMDLPDVTVDSNYQLTVEDAANLATHDVVIFADASVKGKEPFFFKKIEPKPGMNFSTHSIEPEGVLGYAHQLFGAKTVGYTLGIRGYRFNEFGEEISEKALKNMKQALKFLEDAIKAKDFVEIE
ncbi:MAG: hydrogenase maturation protease [Candidatus Omnitrophica bacterium]|nr:hydrogenase maturation protease [Candidatus Omnitrophota bacterium]